MSPWSLQVTAYQESALPGVEWHSQIASEIIKLFINSGIMSQVEATLAYRSRAFLVGGVLPSV